MERIRPLHDILIVEPETPEKLSAGGIVTNVKTEEAPSKGKVISVGPEVLEAQARVGDTVIFTTNTIRTDKEDGRTLVWMRIENVLGVVK